MLSNLHKKTWMTGLQLQDFKEIGASNEKTVEVIKLIHLNNDLSLIFLLQEMLELAKSYNKVRFIFFLMRRSYF